MRRSCHARICGIAATLAVCACSPKEAPPQVTVVQDSAGISVVENRVELSTDSCRVSAEPDVRIGEATGADEYQLYSVTDATVLSDGAIALLNRGSAEVRIYEPDGTFRLGFGREGEGPGEFRNLWQIEVLPGDTLVIGDYRPWRYQWFTTEGDYLEVLIPEPPFINTPRAAPWLAPDEFVLASTWGPPRSEQFEVTNLSLTRFTTAGEPVGDTIGVFPHSRRGWLSRELRYSGTALFAATTRVAGAEGRLYVGMAREREIEMRDATGSLLGFIRWSGPDRTVTASVVEAYRQELLAEANEASAAQQRLQEARVSDDRPVSERFPAHAGLWAGEEGDLWVHEYPRPDRPDQGREWLIFDREGRFQCHADIPEDLMLFEIGADYVLALIRDDLGVEYLGRYALTRPGS